MERSLSAEEETGTNISKEASRPAAVPSSPGAGLRVAGGMQGWEVGEGGRGEGRGLQTGLWHWRCLSDLDSATGREQISLGRHSWCIEKDGCRGLWCRGCLCYNTWREPSAAQGTGRGLQPAGTERRCRTCGLLACSSTCSFTHFYFMPGV